MRKTLLLALLCGSLVCALSANALARGGRGRARGGVVMGPFGPLYDTRSPEWRMSGGNIFAYQQLMEAKMRAQRERLMLRRMQQAEKLQRAKTRGKTGSKPQPNAQPRPPRSQFTQPVWVDEFGQPLINHHRPRKRSPSATKPAADNPTKP